ncbi:MAG: DUF3460 family protein [Gallionella sp.]|jgi:hypothetical protein|nr:DUF3460 family protein [Gallionella sp.]
MDKAYVSEFMNFMNRYLEEHPEVVEEQRRGWAFFWNAKVDPTAAEITKKNRVPDDSYGFSWPAWRAKPLALKKSAGSGTTE